MALLEALTDAVARLADTAADIANPRGVVVITSPMEPGLIPDNDSLTAWGHVRAAVDAGYQPVVIFEKANPRARVGRSPILQSIQEMSTGADGRSRVVTVGLTPADERGERQLVPGENIFKSIQRAGTGLQLPVGGVIVGFPPAGAERGPDFPRQLRDFFRNPELSVVAAYAEAQQYMGERYAVSNGFRETYRSQVELDVQNELMQYNAVAVRNEKIRKVITAFADAHLDATGGRDFYSAYPLLTRDENGGLQANITIGVDPKARFVTHGMAPELREIQAEAVAEALGVSTEIEHDSYFGQERALLSDAGLGISRQPLGTQVDYGLIG